MFTRVAQRKQPRRSVYLMLVAASVAALLVSSVALALISDGPGTFDITVASSATSRTADLGNATVEYIGSSAANQSSGTGLFDPFVRLQGSPTEAGYNTCSQSSCGGNVTEFETKTGSWTHAILASAIPVVDCDGDGSGTALCWELFVDINEGNSAKYVSLNEVEIWLTTDPRITDYDATTGFAGATQAYDFTGSILIHDVNQGSGRGDLRYLVPVQPSNAGDYFVLYSKWGTTAGSSPDGKTWGSEGGFEEWKVRKAPNVSVLKVANPVGPVAAGGSIGFDITVTNSGAAAASNVTITDNLPAGGALSWSLSPAFSGCSISGAVGSQILTCTFASIASGDTVGPIHITSGTTDADCAVVPNTAVITAGGVGSSTANVTVTCGALSIQKQSSKGGNPLVQNAGAVFSVTGTASFSVTDNGTNDEDSTIGSVCVSGLAPGSYTINETTPPSGYGDATQTDVGVTVVNGTSCTAGSLPGAGATATFINDPLAEIEVLVTDLGSGETHSSITCALGATTVDPVDENGDPDPAFDDEDEVYTDLAPGTYTCTVVVDP